MLYIVPSRCEHATPDLTMRQPSSNPSVRWSARIARADMERFHQLHPTNGAITSIISLGLEIFLDEVEVNSALVNWCRGDIMHHLYDEEKETDAHPVAIRVPRHLYERFVVLFPEFGATTWFMRRVIYAYLEKAPPLRDVVAETMASIYSRNESPTTSLR